jgi:hypothetical protein
MTDPALPVPEQSIDYIADGALGTAGIIMHRNLDPWTGAMSNLLHLNHDRTPIDDKRAPQHASIPPMNSIQRNPL